MGKLSKSQKKFSKKGALKETIRQRKHLQKVRDTRDRRQDKLERRALALPEEDREDVGSFAAPTRGRGASIES